MKVTLILVICKPESFIIVYSNDLSHIIHWYFSLTLHCHLSASLLGCHSHFSWPNIRVMHPQLDIDPKKQTWEKEASVSQSVSLVISCHLSCLPVEVFTKNHLVQGKTKPKQNYKTVLIERECKKDREKEMHKERAPFPLPLLPNTPRIPSEHSHQLWLSSPQPGENLARLYEMSDTPERRAWLDKLLAFMDDNKTPITACPTISKNPLDLYALYLHVRERGGFVEVSRWDYQWNVYVPILKVMPTAYFSMLSCELRYNHQSSDVG